MQSWRMERLNNRAIHDTQPQITVKVSPFFVRAKTLQDRFYVFRSTQLQYQYRLWVPYPAATKKGCVMVNN